MLAPTRPDHHALLNPRIAKGGNVAAHKAPKLGVALIGPHAHYMGDGHGSKFGGISYTIVFPTCLKAMNCPVAPPL